MITWIDSSEFRVDGTSFKVLDPDKPPNHDVLTIMKERPHIDAYARLAEEIGSGANIVELGIRTGASTAFMSVLFKPRVLSAFEIKKAGTAAFGAFLQEHPDARRIRTHFGCDQGDAQKLAALVDGDFDGPLDLVVDDASHLLPPSIESFNVLFPRLRSGGIYVIEDWSWEHYSERMIGKDFHADRLTGFARLVLSATLASAYSPDAVAKVVSTRGVAIIYRGEATLEPRGFDLNDLLGDRGQQLLNGHTY